MDVAVLFLVFNRPEHTARAFESIRKARPRLLYVAADGPRLDVEGERDAVITVREIATNTDWDCEIKTLFRDTNLGCKKAVISGLDWFFQHEEEGLIIEDDLIASPSFFRYAQELLEYYRHDEKVFTISGCNIGYENKKNKNSYSFSIFMNMWGWATWRRAYKKIDFEMKEWNSFNTSNALAKKLRKDRYKKWLNYWISTFDKVYEGKVDTWDYQWIHSQLLHDGVSVVPAVNMITNTGFGELATHTANLEHLDMANLIVQEINFPLRHPHKIKPDKKYEKFIIRGWCGMKLPTPYKIIKKELTMKLDYLVLKPTRGIRGKLGMRKYQIDERVKSKE